MKLVYSPSLHSLDYFYCVSKGTDFVTSIRPRDPSYHNTTKPVIVMCLSLVNPLSARTGNERRDTVDT